MADKITKESGAFYDKGGNIVATFTSSDGGDRLRIDVGEIIVDFVWGTTLLFGDGVYYSPPPPDDCTMIVVSCVEHNNDGCYQWGFSVFHRDNPHSAYPGTPTLTGTVS